MTRPEQRYMATAKDRPRKTGRAMVGVFGLGSMCASVLSTEDR
jgi:hypothetical protein